MKKLLGLLLGLLLTGCGVGFKYTTLNHAGHLDGIYSSNDYKIDTLNEFQVRNKLRTDFQFRYDYAQYALSQPISFDWNNRLLGNRYNWNRPYWGYSYYWDRTQMWNDWVWGYNWYSPYPMSSFGNNWGPYPYYGWNNLGYNVVWNRSRRTNVSYVNSYRTTNRTSTRTVVNNTNRRIRSTSSTNNNRVIRVNKPKINNNSRPRVNNNSRPTPTIRTTPRTSPRSSNNTTVRSNSRRKN